MKSKALMMVSSWAVVGAWAVAGLGSGSVAWGQFKCGNVFVAESSVLQCHKPPGPSSPDRIWELNPETGEANLFAEIPMELCTLVTGLAMSPDGMRLRASGLLTSEILEFDPQGNLSIVLGPADGIACPVGFNNLAFDAQGNFYVANDCGSNILRFPADGGPATVFTSGTGSLNAITLAANGGLYYTTILNNFNRLMRVTPDGIATEFDNYGSIISGVTLTADKRGHIYVALESGEIVRYDAGKPASKTVLALLSGAGASMTMSPDQSEIYFHGFKELLGIDVATGAVTTLVDFSEPPRLGDPGGITVVPKTLSPACVPIASTWGALLTAMLIVTAGGGKVSG